MEINYFLCPTESTLSTVAREDTEALPTVSSRALPSSCLEWRLAATPPTARLVPSGSAGSREATYKLFGTREKEIPKADTRRSLPVSSRASEPPKRTTE